MWRELVQLYALRAHELSDAVAQLGQHIDVRETLRADATITLDFDAAHALSVPSPHSCGDSFAWRGTSVPMSGDAAR